MRRLMTLGAVVRSARPISPIFPCPFSWFVRFYMACGKDPTLRLAQQPSKEGFNWGLTHHVPWYGMQPRSDYFNRCSGNSRVLHCGLLLRRRACRPRARRSGAIDTSCFKLDHLTRR